jgi:hypothetical protein
MSEHVARQTYLAFLWARMFDFRHYGMMALHW